MALVDLRMTFQLQAQDALQAAAARLVRGEAVGGGALAPQVRPAGPLGGSLAGHLLGLQADVRPDGWRIRLRRPDYKLRFFTAGTRRQVARPVLGLTAGERQRYLREAGQVAAASIQAALRRS